MLEKQISETFMDSYNGINAITFEDRFDNMLIQKLTKERVVIVMGNEKYHNLIIQILHK